MASLSLKKIIKLTVLGLAIFCGWYVGTRIEFQDPYAPSPYFNSTFMSEDEIKENEIKAISMTPKAARMLYDTFGALIPILDKHNIDYWITCGTLLGAVRHEGIISYDDDIDICIHEKDAKKVLSLSSELNKVGLSIYQDRTSIKAYKTDGPHVRPKKRTFKIMDGIWFVRRKIERFPTIDIYTTKEEKGKVIHANRRAVKSFSKEIFPAEDIYPLKLYQFGPLKVKGPQNPFRFFQYAYGSSWNKLVYYGSHLSKKEEGVSILDITPEIKTWMHRYGVENASKSVPDVVNRS